MIEMFRPYERLCFEIFLENGEYSVFYYYHLDGPYNGLNVGNYPTLEAAKSYCREKAETTANIAGYSIMLLVEEKEFIK